ncbi:MAG: hypothetical protein RIR79_63 [Pseudomonadota bacterium]
MLPLTITQALHWAQDQGLDRLDAQLLLLHVLNRSENDRAWLLIHDTDTLTSLQWEMLQANTIRRAAGEPLAYIRGYKEFFGLHLCVDARVLDPRPDTETLVEWVLEVTSTKDHIRVIDLGTGSGAIALALKHTRPQWDVTAVDVSADALAVARSNAQRLGLVLHGVQSSWLESVTGRFDVIVSNPPYIAEHDSHLPALRHEPHLALTSGVDGLDAIRVLIAQAPQHLNEGSWLLIEHGYDQADAVCDLLKTGGFSAVQSRHDLAGIARCSGGCYRPIR